MSDVTAKVSLSSPILKSNPGENTAQFALFGSTIVMARGGQLYLLSGGQWTMIPGNDYPPSRPREDSAFDR